MFIPEWGHHTKFQTLAVGRVAGRLGGWVDGWDMRRIMPLRSVAPSCKIELARRLNFTEDKIYGI